ncbi:hypothetical protein POTOM_012135 [Populus tomentosa]|uniref:Uncharacterized protein n=1 Tax=Populus tomentosa TaxID=118781 RepID=A0A8X8D9D1_POPTO|nr:hypothetical protein POTOM_012135 [Populus tomentosa]
MKRKRPSNSEFCDMSEATAVSISQSSSLAPVTPRAPVAAADTTRIGVNIAAASVVEIPSGVEFRAPSLVVASTSVGVKDEIDNGVAPSASSGSGSGSGNAYVMLELQLTGRPGINRP